jgi:hypothetical protein
MGLRVPTLPDHGQAAGALRRRVRGVSVGCRGRALEAKVAESSAPPASDAAHDRSVRAILGKALLAMGRREDALRELQEAVRGADMLGSPAARWRARADLAAALDAAGDDDGGESAFREAAGIIREVEASLASERAKRFVAAPQVARVLIALR